MPGAEIQRNISLRKALTALAILALAAMVAFLQISEHRTPRPTFADEHLPGRSATPGESSVGGLITMSAGAMEDQDVLN